MPLTKSGNTEAEQFYGDECIFITAGLDLSVGHLNGDMQTESLM